MNRLCYSLIMTMFPILGSIIEVHAQGGMIPFSDNTYQLIDRYSIRSSIPLNYYSGIRPYARDVITPWIETVSENEELNDRDRYNLRFLLRDNGEFFSDPTLFDQKGIWNTFYRRENAFWHGHDSTFDIVLNPVMSFGAGSASGSDNVAFYQNTRGFQLRGQIAGKVGFYTYLTENQMLLPRPQRELISNEIAIPGYGFYKAFGDSAYDFFNARGYINFSPIEQIRIQFGHDKLFFGNGYRSLIWGDHMKENLFLRLHTNFGRVHYTNVFSQLDDLQFISGTGDGIRKKFSAFHYLGLNLLQGKLNVGVFENIIFSNQDSTGRSSGYEINYLNPIIFYRAVEHGLNSRDNAMLGLDWKWNFLRGYSFYGQVVLDEFTAKEMFGSTGWWGNKWATQLGIRFIDLLNVSNLDLQTEMNIVRPYTYGYSSTDHSATHYNQPIAHPLGANFKEFVAIGRYQILPNLNFRLSYIHATRGLDSSSTASTTFGGQVNTPYSAQSRPKDTGIAIGDGVREALDIIDAQLSFQLFHNGFVDLRYVQRIRDVEAPLKSSDLNLFYVGFRMNIDPGRFDY